MAEIDAFFQYVVDHGGSDLHLSEGQPPKVRIHGDVGAIREEPLTHEEMDRLLREICPPEGYEKFLRTGDYDFAYEMNEEARFRCNYHRHIHGLGGIFRLIPNRIKSIAELNLPPVIQTVGDLKSGLVLVTGPTGSGKSTTLAAIIDYINRKYAKHIVTIEEPIEFVHQNKRCVVTQREVPNDAKTFFHGLKASLREDSDVILVGELRDLETISLALTAAETGLLVFATLHTNNARKTVDRVIDAFPATQQEMIRTMLANSLRAVIAQLLLKRCDSGGRVAVNEILIANPAVGAIIREGATMKLLDVIKTGAADGMQLMDDAIFKHLEAGHISPYEAYMKGIEKQRFEPFLEKHQ